MASCSDGEVSEATAATVGRVCVPWMSSAPHGARRVRCSERARHHPHTALTKTLCGGCGRAHMGWYDRRTRRVRDLPCGDARLLLEIDVRRVRCKSCGHVTRERLDFLADNPFYTKRFAYYVGRRCRQGSGSATESMTYSDSAVEGNAAFAPPTRPASQAWAACSPRQSVANPDPVRIVRLLHDVKYSCGDVTPRRVLSYRHVSHEAITSPDGTSPDGRSAR